MIEKLLTVSDVADRLSVEVTEVSHWVIVGKLKCLAFENELLIPEREIERMIRKDIMESEFD